jgi:hypothetical protein
MTTLQHIQSAIEFRQQQKQAIDQNYSQYLKNSESREEAEAHYNWLFSEINLYEKEMRDELYMEWIAYN